MLVCGCDAGWLTGAHEEDVHVYIYIYIYMFLEKVGRTLHELRLGLLHLLLSLPEHAEAESGAAVSVPVLGGHGLEQRTLVQAHQRHHLMKNKKDEKTSQWKDSVLLPSEP